MLATKTVSLFERKKGINFNRSNHCLPQSPKAVRFAAIPAAVFEDRVAILTLNADATSNPLI